MKKALCIVDISKDVDVDVHNLFLSKLLSLVGSKLFFTNRYTKTSFLDKIDSQVQVIYYDESIAWFTTF